MRSFPRILALIAVLFVNTAMGGVLGDAALATEAKIFDCKPGAWGRVQWHYLHLEAPDWVVEQYNLPHTQTAWVFPGAAVPKLAGFLVESGVSREVVERWFADKRVVTKGSESVTIYPSAADVEALSGRSRALIYPELAKDSRNEYYVNPVKILDPNVDAWLGLRAVRPEIRELLKKLTYLQGSVLCFSDLPVLLSHATDRQEMLDLAQLATRVRAVMAYLQVGGEDDTRSLTSYWTAGFRRKDVLAILNSVSLLPGGGRLGFSHLLPAEARKLMYTYPTPAMAAQGRLPDCHWTAVNFFNDRPQNVFLDLRLVAAEMVGGHDLVQPPYRYGDVLVFLNKAGQGMHSCVYLCEDLVFSKNGELANVPWVVTTLADVRRIYSHLEVDSMRAFRRRWTAGE